MRPHANVRSSLWKTLFIEIVSRLTLSGATVFDRRYDIVKVDSIRFDLVPVGQIRLDSIRFVSMVS